MATVTTMDNRRTRCPVCSSLVDDVDLSRAGLTKEELKILNRHKNEETLGLMIQLVDITMKKMNPDKFLEESEMKRAVAELHRTVDEVKQKLEGTAIGKVGEVITIRELKSVVQQDKFSDEMALKGGADIIATVVEEGKEQGKIVVSVKYDTTWKNEAKRQLKKNMRQEATTFGMLVTKAFPTEALNDKIHVEETRAGGLILLVKPDYAPIAYPSYRQVVIAWNLAQASFKNAEELVKKHSLLYKVIADWISSPKFADALRNIDEAIALSNETDTLAKNLQKNIDQKVKTIRTIQGELRSQLSVVDSVIQELRNSLVANGLGEDGK